MEKFQTENTTVKCCEDFITSMKINSKKNDYVFLLVGKSIEVKLLLFKFKNMEIIVFVCVQAVRALIDMTMCVCVRK